MIQFLFGDDFQVREALAGIRSALAADDEMLASNTTVLDGRTVTGAELLAHAAAVPFLGGHRLVVVEGLVRHLAASRSQGGATDEGDRLDAWRRVAGQLADPAALPESTTVVFVEGAIAKNTKAFHLFSRIGETREFGVMAPSDLPKWVEGSARRRGLTLSRNAVMLIARSIGPDLWAIENELDKLAAYASGEPLDETAVSELLASAVETKIWEFTGGVIDGDERRALSALGRLLDEGEPPTKLAFMVAREYRQVAVMKDVVQRRVPRGDLSRLAGVPPFRLDAVSAIATRYSWAQLRAAYARLLEADLNVKRGLQDDESSLQLLVHDLCTIAPPARHGRAAAGRR